MWAFGTSPHGLGLSSEKFWRLTMREYRALRREWQNARDHGSTIAAALLATMHNGFFKHDGVPWIAADFLGQGNREDRKARATVERFNSQMQKIRAAQKQGIMSQGDTEDDTEGLPAWALGEKKNNG